MCWIGFTDLKASRGEKDAGRGPIGQAAVALDFHEIHLISDRTDSANDTYI